MPLVLTPVYAGPCSLTLAPVQGAVTGRWVPLADTLAVLGHIPEYTGAWPPPVLSGD